MTDTTPTPTCPVCDAEPGVSTAALAPNQAICPADCPVVSWRMDTVVPDPIEGLTYQRAIQVAKDNLGTVIRFPEWNQERVFFSKYDRPDQHAHTLEAALWERTDRPKGASTYKTFIRRSLSSSSGRSIVNDGGFGETYDDAVEWLEAKMATFDGEALKWNDLPKTVISAQNVEECP